MPSKPTKQHFLRFTSQHDIICEIATAKTKNIIRSYCGILRSRKSGWHNVGKLEIAFWGVWLITAVLLNWIKFLKLKGLQLLFHFTTNMNTLCLIQLALFVVENVPFSVPFSYWRRSLSALRSSRDHRDS